MRFSLLPIFSALVLFAGLGNAAPAQLAERNGLEDIVDSVETILSAVVELLEWFLKSVDQSPLPVHSSSFTSSIVQSTTQAITSHVTYAPQTSSTPVFQITSASSSAAEATTSQAAYAPQTSSTPFVQITSAPSSAAEATTSHVTYAPETSSTPFFQITSALSSASQETTSHATYAPQTSSMPFVQITSDVVPVPSSTAVVSPENTQTRGRSPSPTSNPVDVAPQPTVATATASPIISSSASLAAPVVTQPVQSTVVSVPSLSPSTPSSSAQSRCYTGSEFPVEQEWATFNSLFEANLQEMQGFNSDDEIEAIRKSILQAESNSSINATLLYSIMLEESRANCHTKAGDLGKSVGIMQVRGCKASCYGVEKGKCSASQIQDMVDCGVNGTDVFQGLISCMEQYNNNVGQALRCYNSGSVPDKQDLSKGVGRSSYVSDVGNRVRGAEPPTNCTF